MEAEHAPSRVPQWPEWMLRGFPTWMRTLDLPVPGDWPDRDGMRLEELREDDTLVVRAEMPGIDPATDVEITIDDGVLHIRAERRETHEESDEKSGRYRSEFRYGTFTRRLPLPPGATEADVQASYRDGILEIRVPVGEEAPPPRRIPIERT